MSTPSTEQVHRLTDIQVQEVSLVDRAANQRKFVVIKSEGTMATGTEVTPDGNGGHTTTKPTVKMKITAATKSELEKRMTALTALCAEIGKTLTDAEIVTEGSQDADLIKSLERFNEALIGDVNSEVGKALVEKRLKQFSKDRVKSLRDAYALVGDILKEIETGEETVVTPAPTPPVDATKTAVDALATDVKSLADAVTSAVEKINDSITKQAVRLEKVESSGRGMSNGGGDENPVPVTKAADPDKVVWPMDMNRPDYGKEAATK